MTDNKQSVNASSIVNYNIILLVPFLCLYEQEIAISFRERKLTEQNRIRECAITWNRPEWFNKLQIALSTQGMRNRLMWFRLGSCTWRRLGRKCFLHTTPPTPPTQRTNTPISLYHLTTWEYWMFNIFYKVWLHFAWETLYAPNTSMQIFCNVRWETSGYVA